MRNNAMANMNMRRGMLVAAAAACIAIAVARPAPAQDRSTCVAARVVGEAAVLREMSPLPLRPGMPLTQGDQITTGGDGRVEVLCGDGSSLVVGSRTRVRLSIFIAGNEEFTQGPVSYQKAVAKAVGKGVVVNTIHCGDAQTGVNQGWSDAAKLGHGTYLAIDHNAVQLHIATPYDVELAKLSTDLNSTYVAYGRMGREKAKRQMAQDSNAASMGAGSSVARAAAKSSAASDTR